MLIGFENWKWLKLKGEKTKYKISDQGRIKNTVTNHYISTNTIDRYGYVQVCLSHKNKKYVITLHRLVALHFIPNPENKPQVNHKNGNKRINAYWNLEWVTGKENVEHAYRTGLHDNVAIGSRHGNNIYSEESIRKVCELLQEAKLGYADITKKTGVPRPTIKDILDRKYWTHISKEYDFSNYSLDKIRGYDAELKKKIIKLAKQGKSVHEIRVALKLPYSDKMNARITYQVKKFKNRKIND